MITQSLKPQNGTDLEFLEVLFALLRSAIAVKTDAGKWIPFATTWDTDTVLIKTATQRGGI